MLWLSNGVFASLWLLAPVAFFAALKVIVLALGALPSSFGKIEVLSLPVFLLGCNSLVLDLLYSWSEALSLLLPKDLVGIAYLIELSWAH